MERRHVVIRSDRFDRVYQFSEELPWGHVTYVIIFSQVS